jgi:hypothetical protein
MLAARRGDLDTAEETFRDVVYRFEDVRHVTAAAWVELADIAYWRDEIQTADEYISRGIELFRDLGDRWQVAISTSTRAGLLVDASTTDAVSAAIDAIAAFTDLGDYPDLVIVLHTAAYLLLRCERPNYAAVIMGAAQVYPPDTPRGFRVTRLVEKLQAGLSDPARAVDLERGRRLGLRDAADAAIEWLQPFSRRT